MGLVDTHAHLGDAVFDADRSDVLARARRAGVTAIVTVGETLADARRNLELADLHSEIRPTAGLYPTHLDVDQASELVTFVRERRDRIVAIGEVGLDYWKVKEQPDLDIQRA